jgi:hypothetical protein
MPRRKTEQTYYRWKRKFGGMAKWPAGRQRIDYPPDRPLVTRLEQDLSAVDAQLPMPNPQHDPGTPAPTREKGTNKDMKQKKKA